MKKQTEKGIKQAAQASSLVENLSDMEAAAYLNVSVRHWRSLRGKLVKPGAGQSIGGINRLYRRALKGAPNSVSGVHEQGSDRIDADYERARLLRAQASIRSMEERKMRGELLDAHLTGQVNQLMLTRFKMRVEQLPSKLLPVLAAAQTDAERLALFTAGIDECLNELADLDVQAVMDEGR